MDIRGDEVINVFDFKYLNSIEFEVEPNYLSEVNNMVRDTSFKNEFKLSVEKLRQYIQIDLDVVTVTKTGFKYIETFPFRLCNRQDFLSQGLPEFAINDIFE